MNPLKELARDIATERRKHLATGTDLHRSLKNQLEALDRVSEERRKRVGGMTGRMVHWYRGEEGGWCGGGEREGGVGEERGRIV